MYLSFPPLLCTCMCKLFYAYSLLLYNYVGYMCCRLDATAFYSRAHKIIPLKYNYA